MITLVIFDLSNQNNMKKFEILVIGTYITRIIEAANAKEAKEIARKQLVNIPNMRLKATELNGFFA